MPHPAAPQVSLVFPQTRGRGARHTNPPPGPPPVTDIARSRLVTTVLPRGRVTCCGHYVPSGQTTDHDGRNRVHLSGHMGHYGRSRVRSPGRAQRLAAPPRRPAAAHCRVPTVARRSDGCSGKPPWRAAPVICLRPRGDLPAPRPGRMARGQPRVGSPEFLPESTDSLRLHCPRAVRRGWAGTRGPAAGTWPPGGTAGTLPSRSPSSRTGPRTGPAGLSGLATAGAIPGGFARPGHTARRIPVEPGEAQLRCRYRERRAHDG